MQANAAQLADAHKRIKVLESLLANTYSAHPKLVDWAIQNKGEFKVDSIAEACRQSSESRNVEKQAQARKIAKLRSQRDQWRTRAHQLKEMCKELQSQLQTAQPLQATNADPFLDDTAQLLPNGCTMQAPWAMSDSSSPWKPSERAQQSQGDSSELDTDESTPVMFFPGLSIRTSCASSNTLASSDQIDMHGAPASPRAVTSARGRAGSTTRPILRNTSTNSTTKRSSGKVTLHESQNITHEYVKADSPSEEKMPSIMDLLNARGGEQSDSDSLPLPAVMQDQNAPCASMTSTMCPGRQQTHKYVKQDSMGVDDATKSVLSDVLAYSSTDESKNTPPLDFFAAAGLIDSFTYSPTAATTPPYFKSDSMSLEEVESRHPFGRTHKKSLGMADTLGDESAFIGFCAYDEPETEGSAMSCLALSANETSKDISDRLFSTSAGMGRCTNSDGSGSENSNSISGRLFGDNLELQASGAFDDEVKAGTLDWQSAPLDSQWPDQTMDDDSMKDALTQKLFGSQEPGIGEGSTGMAQQLNGLERLAAQPNQHVFLDDVECKAELTQRIFGPSTSEIDEAEDDIVCKAELTQRLFGREQLDLDTDAAPVDEEAQLKQELTQRLFGNDQYQLDDSPPVDEEAELKQELTQRLFGNDQYQLDDSPSVDEEAELKQDLTQRLFGNDRYQLADVEDGCAEDQGGQELLDLPSNQDREHVKESATSAQDEDDFLKQNLTQKLFGPTPTLLEDEDDLRKKDLTQRLFGRQEPDQGHESSSAAVESIRSHAVDNPMEDELDTNRKNMTERLFGNTGSVFHAQQQPSPEQHQRKQDHKGLDQVIYGSNTLAAGVGISDWGDLAAKAAIRSDQPRSKAGPVDSHLEHSSRISAVPDVSDMIPFDAAVDSGSASGVLQVAGSLI